MNKCVILGNLTRNPELRTTASGLSVCQFTVAVGRKSKDKDECDFIPTVTWRGLADNCGQYLKKGSKVAVSGRIQTRSYDDNNGNRRYVTEIVADDVMFLTPKNNAPVEPPADTDGLLEDDKSDFEPLDDEQLPF